MPRDADVLCLHCQQYMSRSRECAHRAKHQAPLYSPPPQHPSRLRRIFNMETESELGQEADSQAGGCNPDGIDVGAGRYDAKQSRDEIQATEASILDWWGSRRRSGEEEEDDHNADEEELEDSPDGSLSDSDLEIPEWDAFEPHSGLSSWDQLGEGFEKSAAESCALPLICTEDMMLIGRFTANKLSAYDLAICRAFSYKVQTHTTDHDFRKLPYAFPTDTPLPGLDKIRSRIMFLSGFQPQQYDCCPKTCYCYVGPHANLSACPYCGEARYRADGKPRKKYTYIPIIPRLVSFLRNPHMAKHMQYRASHQDSHRAINDIFDGSHYRSLRRQHVQLNGRKFNHMYFEDRRDVALGLSADGFSPFKKRKKTAWAFILFNYNLPPELRFHVEHILALGVVGPRKPVDPDSFLWPAIQELLRLAVGVRAYDFLTSAIFCLRAFLILVFGDLPAVAMLMRMKGHNGIRPCRMCNITSLRISNSRSTTHYVPLDRSSHPEVHSNSNAIKAFDPSNLPMRTHNELYSQADEVQTILSDTKSDELATVYGVKGISIFFHLPSIRFPVSFPYDFMHLIWENLVPNLIRHWTSNFKALDQGLESYEFPKSVWEAIGKATANAGSSIPSSYGCRVPDIAKDHSYYSADMWSFWTTFLGPVLLRRRFQCPKYYTHFIHLVHLLNICLQFEITNAQIEEVRLGFIQWVKDYEE